MLFTLTFLSDLSLRLYLAFFGGFALGLRSCSTTFNLAFGAAWLSVDKCSGVCNLPTPGRFRFLLLFLLSRLLVLSSNVEVPSLSLMALGRLFVGVVGVVGVDGVDGRPGVLEGDGDRAGDAPEADDGDGERRGYGASGLLLVLLPLSERGSGGSLNLPPVGVGGGLGFLNVIFMPPEYLEDELVMFTIDTPGVTA